MKTRLTKRASDAGDSGEIPSSFLRLSLFLAGRLRRPRPSAGNANRWATQEYVLTINFQFWSNFMVENNEDWIAGDGGPIVILQSEALPYWKGAADFDKSIMNGGSLETDYDVICRCDNYHIYRHNRDMLVLDDSECSARIFRLENGTIMVEQVYYMSEEFQNVVQQVAQAQPKQTFSITIKDDRLRLLVGADSADGNLYGFSEIDIAPGLKRCDVYSFDNVLAIKISAE